MSDLSLVLSAPRTPAPLFQRGNKRASRVTNCVSSLLASVRAEFSSGLLIQPFRGSLVRSFMQRIYTPDKTTIAPRGGIVEGRHTASEQNIGLREVIHEPVPAFNALRRLSVASRYGSTVYKACTLLVVCACSCELAIAAATYFTRRKCFKRLSKCGR